MVQSSIKDPAYLEHRLNEFLCDYMNTRELVNQEKMETIK